MVQGLAALERKLTVIIPRRVKAATKAAMERGAQELVDMMKRLVPKDSGDLRDSIGWTWGAAPRYSQKIASVKSQDGDLAITIYAGNDKVRYAHIVEFGSEAHINEGKFAGTKHPGTTAQPFFYVSWRVMRKRIKSRVTREMRKAIRSAGSESDT